MPGSGTKRLADHLSMAGDLQTKWAIIATGLALLAAACLKLWLALCGRVPFNADEAVVGLMARHILQGHWPLFFYGQAYMGSLDPILIAPFFKIFGEFVWVIRLVQLLLYLGVLGTTFAIARQVFGGITAGLSSIWLLAIPAVTLTLYTTASIGDYVEALLLGNCILLTAFRIANRVESERSVGTGLWFVFGFLGGFGIWVFGLTLVYTLPSALYLLFLIKRTNETRGGLKKDWARAGAATTTGLIVGMTPIWIFFLRHGIDSVIKELGGSAIAGVENLGWLLQTLQHLLNLTVLGGTSILGFRPSWEIRWIALPILPIVLIFWLAVGRFTIQKLRSSWTGKGKLTLLVFIPLSVFLAFIFTPFGADPSGRYFIPVMVILAVLGGGFIQALQARIGVAAFGVLAVILVFHLWGNMESALRFPPGLTTQFDPVSQIDHSYDQALIDFLEEAGERRGYTNYWVSYPLAFLSSETLIFAPRLPYHPDFRYTERDDRYQPYTEIVDASDRTAYITTRNPELDSYLREAFSDLAITWEEWTIGDYQIYYDLSRPVLPYSIGLGITTP